MPKKQDNPKLNIIGVAIGLVSLHYGLGFLLGTGEMVYKNGLCGSLYAFMCALGLLLLGFLVPFYWKSKHPIWTLLGNKYGQKVRNGVVFLSWLWMIGVTASQILGATYIVNMFGFPIGLSSILVLVSVVFVSLLPVEKLSKLLLSLLLINSAVLLYGLFKLINPSTAHQILLDIPSQMTSAGFMPTLGIAIPTILITMLGMDFHQFIVQAKDTKKALFGTILASIILFLIVFLPTAIVIGAKANNILPLDINGKQVIPFILVYLGKTTLGDKFSHLFLLAILTVSLGSGSCLFRILTKTFINFDFLPKKLRQKKLVILANSLIVYLLAIKGGTLVSLIVSFYVIYIVGVLIPFIAYLLEKNHITTFKSSIIYSSLISGTLISLIVLILSKASLLPVGIIENLEFVMILTGVTTSFLTLLTNKLIYKYFL